MKFSSRTTRPFERHGVRIAAVAGAVGLLAASLAACSGSDSKGGSSSGAYSDTINMSFVTPSVPSDPYWGSVKAGAQQAAKDFGVKLEYLAPTTGSDATAEEAQLLKAAVSKKPDALVVGDAFPSALDPLIKQASDAGVTTVLMNQKSEAEVGNIGFVGQNDFDAGVAAGKRMADEGAKKVLVPEVPGLAVSEQRVGGFEKGYAGSGGSIVKVAIPLAKVTDPAAVGRAIQASMSSNNDIDSIMAIGVVVWTPATTALKQTGQTGKIKLASFDISTNALKSLATGETLFLVDQQPYLQGYYSVQMAAQRIRYGLLPAGGEIATGPNFLTKSDAADVLKKNAAGVRGAS